MKKSSAIVTRNWHQTPQTKHLQVLLDSDKRLSSYKKPGQYCIISLQGEAEKGKFALSSIPGESTWSFLIKPSSPLSQELFNLVPGDSLNISEAQGPGYLLKLPPASRALCLCVGTGIAPIRPLINELLSKKQAVTLFYGVKNPREFAYLRDISQWKQQGTDIHLITSDILKLSWQGPRGRIGDFLNRETAPKNAIAFLCGMPEMIKEITKKLIGLGIKKNAIRLNY